MSALVLEDGGSEELAIAALLHDAIEDGGGKKREEAIRARFGDAVANVVVGCTDTDKEPKPGWADRKRDYISHLREAPEDVLRVSVADKLHNARAILADYRRLKAELFWRFTATGPETVGYYVALSAVFSDRLPGSQLARELDITVTALVDESGVQPLPGAEWHTGSPPTPAS